MKHNEWFEKRVGIDSRNAAAKKAGLAQNSLGRQLEAGTLPAESVIKISRAYDYNPVQGLVDTGYIAIDEAQGEVKVINWDEVEEVDLLEEVLRRAKINSKSVLNAPLTPEVIDNAQAPRQSRPVLRAVQTPVNGIPVITEEEAGQYAALDPGYDAVEESIAQQENP